MRRREVEEEYNNVVLLVAPSNDHWVSPPSSIRLIPEYVVLLVAPH